MAKVYRTDSCSECNEQQCEDDMNCDQCDKNLIELKEFICDGGEHFCNKDCQEELNKEVEND